jgi:hypothetical protein
LLNATSISLGKLAKPRSSALGSISAGTTFANTRGLDEVAPLQAKNMRALAINRQWARDRETEGAVNILLFELFIKSSVPVSPVGEPLELMTGEALEMTFFIGHG